MIVFAAISGIGEQACKGAGEILGGAFEQFDKIGDSILSVVRGTDGTSQISIVSSQIHSAVKGTAIPALQGVAYSIAMLFFLLALIDLIKNDRLTTEMFIKFFINLFVAIFFISQSPAIYDTVIKFGDGLGELCTGIFNSASWDAPSKSQITDQLIYFADLPKSDPNHKGWMETLMLSTVAGGPIYLISLLLTGVTYLIAFSRLIELAVRGAFLPIGFSLLSDDGFKGAGGRYFRKFIAICAQVAMLIMIAGITTLIIATVGKNITDAMFTGASIGMTEMMGKLVVLLGAAVACVSIMFKSIGLINDVFGA